MRPITTVQCWTGAETKALRQAMRLSIRAFAAHLGVGARTVNKWEARGSTITLRPDTQALMDTALDRAPDEVQTRFAQTLDSGRQQQQTNHTQPIELAPPRTDMVSRPSHAVLLSAAPEHVITHLQEQWHLLVQTDNLFGPTRVLRLVHEQIELIEALLRNARGGVRASLLSLGAEYAESAAWLHEDAEDQKAHFWTGRALEWAHAAGDHRLVAWALFRRSQQVATERDASQAIGLARAAQDKGPHLPDQMRAAVTQQEAYGLALDGDEAACQRKLDEALQWAAPADLYGDARSGHGAFCTASYIELQRAKCWQTLGRPQRAVPIYQTALADLPACYHRDRGHGLASLPVR